MRVAVIGTGYVGLTTGVALAYLGHKVVGVDKDPSKIALLSKGKSPIHEPGIEELLVEIKREQLTFTEDTAAAVRDAELIMIAVGTPAKANGEADTSYVEAAAEEVAQSIEEGKRYILVVKSTVPIGTNRRVSHVIEQVLKKRGIQAHVYLASNPEFLREGLALRDTFYPDRIVVGSESPEAVEALRRLYRPILEQTFNPPGFLPRPESYDLPPLITTDPTSAEMIKYAANACLALKISFINEIAGLCEKVGADVVEVARGIGLDARIGPAFLGAGIGWGGSCFPKDTAALLAMGREYNYAMPIVAAAREVNWRQRERVIEKLQSALKVLRGSVIGVLGLAFKPGTDDVRESPAIDVVRLLLERGAHVRVHDPVAVENARKELGSRVEYYDNVYELARDADALVLATEWSQYFDLDFAELAGRMRQKVFVDGRNIFTPSEVTRWGFIYMGMGR
ncbi:MAG: UDP-glucose/GDP-mannose dehydrogenase family protein [Gammaproteobacteria bacterium]|nr:UDP-glucose/GDP-mannose dehydrogenase family protein [Gammaproteobacteria bacterium]